MRYSGTVKHNRKLSNRATKPEGKGMTEVEIGKLTQILCQRQRECHALLENLLACQKLSFDNTLHGELPELPGIYAISATNASAGIYLRAGRTKTGAGVLRQRIYHNHFMGNQRGNLRAQLVSDGICADIEEAKRWVSKYCVVQFMIVQEADVRRWVEYYMLSLLRPKYCD